MSMTYETVYLSESGTQSVLKINEWVNPNTNDNNKINILPQHCRLDGLITKKLQQNVYVIISKAFKTE
jgi:hypothetical protein